MQKAILHVSCAVLISALAACSGSNYVQEVGFCTALPDKDTVVFDGNKPVALFTSCGDNIQAKVSQVADSRCPVGVNCIWAGKLSVMLDMDELHMTLEKDKVKDTFYRNNRYSFFLVDALPLPTAQNNPPAGNRQVIINITRGNRSQLVQPGNVLPVASDSTKKPLVSSN